jgi:hypothetical protein
MDAIARRQNHAPVRVLPHIETRRLLRRLPVRVVCECGARREIKPEALVVLSHTRQLRMCTAGCSAT